MPVLQDQESERVGWEGHGPGQLSLIQHFTWHAELPCKIHRAIWSQKGR